MGVRTISAGDALTAECRRVFRGLVGASPASADPALNQIVRGRPSGSSGLSKDAAAAWLAGLVTVVTGVLIYVRARRARDESITLRIGDNVTLKQAK